MANGHALCNTKVLLSNKTNFFLTNIDFVLKKVLLSNKKYFVDTSNFVMVEFSDVTLGEWSRHV